MEILIALNLFTPNEILHHKSFEILFLKMTDKITLQGIKVVGKINVQCSNWKKDRFDNIFKAYKHFNQRLSERYDLKIKLNDYKRLCNKKIKDIRMKDNRVTVGIIKIQMINVLVLYRSGKYVTALPRTDKRYLK